ncbi:Glycosyl Hydrolase 7 [Hyalella azteca]|uniref:cellulase n=1 Tax=Hyalella azteca TaxID=294128 RepID=A0A6A0H919_HYAAZ|nr:Glycosyl Hydrolase 7 [Hyalella azteca]
MIFSIHSCFKYLYHVIFQYILKRQSLNVFQACDSNGCVTEDTKFVMGPSRRYLYSVADNGQTGCRTSDGGFDPVLCPDGLTCAENCALIGITQQQYDEWYGTTTVGSSLSFRWVTEATVGADGYLLATDDRYKVFRMKNREFAFDVDMSQLPCGMNGAIYFVEMEEDGGMASYPSNKAGAAYGLGSCDAQCKHDLPFYAGQVNVEGYAEEGVCCFEFDLWEANAWAASYTTHGCSSEGYYLCTGLECGDGDDRYNGVCDKDGCGYNSFAMNEHFFYGANDSYVVDTRRPFTVVTQFITNDGTDNGDVIQAKRIYVQDGVVIENSHVNYPGLENYNSVSDGFCNDYAAFTGGMNHFEEVGGMKVTSDALGRGVMIAFSLWADYGSHMLWLDGPFPPDSDPTEPGHLNGPCSADSGDPNDLIANYPDSTITFSNIKYGTIGSTFSRK